MLKHPGLDLLVAPTDAPKGILIVVTPGRIGNAVLRNLVRRRIKAIINEEQLLARGLDLVVFVKKDGVTIPYEQLKQLIVSSLQQKIR